MEEDVYSQDCKFAWLEHKYRKDDEAYANREANEGPDVTTRKDQHSIPSGYCATEIRVSAKGQIVT